MYVGTGYFEIELLTISGNFSLQNDAFTYSLCFHNPEEDDKMMNRKYEIENKARAILKKQKCYEKTHHSHPTISEAVKEAFADAYDKVIHI